MSNAFLCKICSVLLSLTLVVVPFCSFADDESVADPVYGSAPLSFTLEEWEFISQASDVEDRQLRQASVIMAATSTYDIDDIYSILSSVRIIDNSRYVWATYDESVWSEVHNVYNKLITNSYNNTWYSISELVALLLSQFSSFSSNFYSPISGSASLWQLTDDIKTFVGLGLFDSNANPYLSLIDTKIGTLTSSMTSGFNAVLSSINSTTSAVNSTTNSVNNVVSSVDSFSSDFNHINWSSSNSSYLGYSSSFNGSYIIPSGTSSLSPGTYYFKFSSPSNINDINIFKFTIRGRSSTFALLNYVVSDLKFYRSNGNILNGQYNVSYDSTRGQLYIYFYNGMLPANDDIIFSLTFNSSFNLSSPSSSLPNNLYYLNGSDIDFYLFNSYLFANYASSSIDRFVQLYASDDLIHSKQAQQGLEDQVLDDFTGSGSASAKVADAVDVKGVQGQVLGALGSSASASDLTTILNTSNPGSDNSFFSFFTQRVYNDLNNVQSTRAVVQEDDIYINLLEQRNDEYINLLGGSW